MLRKTIKANVILEYGVLLVIVLGAMAGINAYLKRHIQARVKHESDTYLGHGQGLEWEMYITHTDSDTSVDRKEDIGADFRIVSKSGSDSITITPPMPPYIMEHKGSALHIQDAPSKPSAPDYPDLVYDKWDLEGTWEDKPTKG